MKTRTLTAVVIVGTVSLACLCSGGNGDRDSNGVDTSPYSYDHETPEDTATAEIPEMTATGSFCTVGFSELDLDAEPGSWRGNGTSNSVINCTAEGDEVVFTMELDGNLENNRLVFPVDSVSFARGDVSVWFYKYVDTGGEGDFVIDGRSSNGKYLWGHFEGSIELTDTVEGGTMTLDELVLVSWPHF